MPGFNGSWMFSRMTSFCCLVNVLFFWTTGGDSDRMPNWCSVMSRDMAPKLCGSHAKMSMYLKRMSRTSWIMGVESVLLILIFHSGCALMIFSNSNSPRGWKYFVIAWSRLCWRAKVLASSLNTMKRSWLTSLLSHDDVSRAIYLYFDSRGVCGNTGL